MAPSMIRLGIDLGGSKIEIVALAADGSERFRRRVPTPQDGYLPVLDAIADLVAAADAAVGARGSVGIGTPGSISRATGLLRGSNSTYLNDKPVGADLEQRLGRAVRITNDANCFALSEATDGAAAGAETVFGVILGTGVGAGIVVRGRVLIGPNAIAGEWGHNPMPWPEEGERPGPPCFCGQSGCIEMFLSGPGLEREHGRGTGKALAAREIAAAAAAGDAACEASLIHYERRLARALAHVINILDPDVIVLGGGLSNMHRLYDNVPRLWGEWVFSDRVDTRLVAHRHGDSSGVRGAAWLWDDIGGGGGRRR
jgi:fructokinase